MTHYKQAKDRLAGLVGNLPFVKQAADWVWGSGNVIFGLHRVLPKATDSFEPELCTSEETFCAFLDWIVERFKVVPLPEMVPQKGYSSDRKRPCCAITFDDGWNDNFLYAFPHLQRLNLSATIFLPTRFIGTSRRFWQEQLWLCFQELKTKDSQLEVIGKIVSRLPWFPPVKQDQMTFRHFRQVLLTRPSIEADEFAQRITDYAGLTNAFPGRSFLNWDEVKKMQAAGILFGSHTLNHTLLPNAPPSVAQREICHSRRELESRIGEDVTGFAYPWGEVGCSSVDQLRESGYKFAVTIRPGSVETSSHPLLLPRIMLSNSMLVGCEGKLDRGKARLFFVKQILGSSTRRLSKKMPEDRSKPIKILFVLDLITEWEGGTERQLRLLISFLDRRYFEPKLCFLFEPPPGIREQALPCPLIVVSQALLYRSPLGRVLALLHVLKKERPDIVQCFFVEGIVAGILAGRLAGVPQVVGSVRNSGDWRKFGHLLAQGAVTPLAKHWQTNSRALWRFQNQREGVAAAKIEILPNGTDLSRFVPATSAERQRIRQELGLNQAGPICVSVANLHEVKGLETLIESAARLKDEFPFLQVLLVGGGPKQEELQELTRQLGITELVKFIGRQHDVRPFLAAADVGVLTSHSEGSSNSVLEYMAMGLPCVLSDIAANRELAEGLFFTPGDARDLAEKVQLLLQDADLCSQLRAQYTQTIAQFTVERFALRVESFYNKLATESANA